MSLKTKAYIPSVADLKTLRKKCLAYSAAKISQTAKEKEAFADSHQQGYYFLRTATEDTNDMVYCGSNWGTALGEMVDYEYASLRLGVSLIYDPNSTMVQNCEIKKMDSFVYSDMAGEITYLISKAPVINFGGIDYVWLNQKECQNGQDNVMSCISVGIVDKAQQFDSEGKNNDYEKAEEIHNQCNQLAFENATETEMEMVVEVEMSKEDGYEGLTYHFTDRQKEIIEKVSQQGQPEDEYSI